ncbi:hypothetical protein ALC60_03079, partial [Trachymyrmex zeteki]
ALLDLFSLDRKIEAVDPNGSHESREKEKEKKGRDSERDTEPLRESRYLLFLSLSLYLFLSFSFSLRGLFRAAISFPLKWPDPIRFHGVLRYARVHASLTLFSIDGWLVQCDRPSPS